jgi:nucleotide-binding universal stress UspA family protein
MIKDIVVNLSVGKPKDVAGEFAVSAAALFNARLTAIAFAQECPIGQSVSDYVNRSIIQQWRADRKAEAERAEREIRTQAGLAGVDCETRVLTHSTVDAAKVFGAIARNHDLSVVAQSEPDSDPGEALIIQAALFESGRPVLVVPYIQSAPMALNRVMVCWDGSKSAARAIGDALPLLGRAGHVDVVTVDARDRRNELRGADIAAHLARHGLDVELKPVVASDVDVANVILSAAADNETDLIVMGGFGHSRFREFVLGGATRGILGSMTVPVLMSH